MTVPILKQYLIGVSEFSNGKIVPLYEFIEYGTDEEHARSRAMNRVDGYTPPRGVVVIGEIG